MARVVVLGASLTDMNLRLPQLPAAGETRLGGTFFMGPGGKGANQAIAARRAGAEVVLLTAFGDDELSRRLIEHDRAEGIDLDHAKIVAGRASGVALILVGEDGENLIGVAPGPNADYGPDDVDRLPDSVFKAGGVLLASLEVPLAAVDRAIRRAKAAGMMVVLNPAPADAGLLNSDLLRFVDVLTPNAVELRTLAAGPPPDGADGTWRATRDLFARGLARAVVTLGAEGCVVAEADPESHRRIPAYRAEVVDTVGAGDAFNAVLAVALAEGLPIFEAARRAAAAGALAVGRPGAQGALPSRSEIDAVLISELDPT